MYTIKDGAEIAQPKLGISYLKYIHDAALSKRVVQSRFNVHEVDVHFAKEMYSNVELFTLSYV